MLEPIDYEQAFGYLVDLIRYKTVSRDAVPPHSHAYDECAAWLFKTCKDVGLEAQILPESVPHKPIVVATWEGKNKDLPVIVLNSHYDVVPVIEEFWTVPSFDGFTRDGKIYGRGAQDMKCVCAQYLAAISNLKRSGVDPIRSIVLTFVPDEEIGGADGMGVLLSSNFFKSIENKIAVALDEGLASEDETYTVFYGERLPWWVAFTAVGNSGHGSRFIEGTAVEQIIGVSNKALEFRQQQKVLLHNGDHSHANCSHSVAAKRKKLLGDVTTLNITSIHAGVKSGDSDVVNLIPPTAVMKADVRIAPQMSPQYISDTFDSWCQEITRNTSGLPNDGGVKWDFVYPPLKEHQVTNITLESSSNESNENTELVSDGKAVLNANDVWYGVIKQTLLTNFDIKVNPSVFPAATDSRFLRAIGVRAFGLSPMRNSPILLHEHDEYILIDNFKEGCRVYAKLIASLSALV